MPRRLNIPIATGDLVWSVGGFTGLTYGLHLADLPTGQAVWDRTAGTWTTGYGRAGVLIHGSGERRGHALSYFHPGGNGRAQRKRFYWAPYESSEQEARELAMRATVAAWQRRYVWRVTSGASMAGSAETWSSRLVYTPRNNSQIVYHVASNGGIDEVQLPTYERVRVQVDHLSHGWWFEESVLVSNAT